MCALRAREEEWRNARSTRNEGRSEVLAVAAYLPLDDKRWHAPLLVPNQRRHEGVAKLDLVVQVVRDGGRLVIDVDRSGRHGRRLWSCEQTPPHTQAQNSESGCGRREAICARRGERQACMWRAVMGVAGHSIIGLVARTCRARLVT